MFLEKNTNNSRKEELIWLGIGIAIGLAFVGAVFAGFYFWINSTPNYVSQQKQVVKETKVKPEKEVVKEEVDKNEEDLKKVHTGKDLYGTWELNNYDGKDYTKYYLKNPLNIEWNSGFTKVTSGEVYDKLVKPYLEKEASDDKVEFCLDHGVGKNECLAYLYEAGKITSPEILAGESLYFLATLRSGMGWDYDQDLVIYIPGMEERLLVSRGDGRSSDVVHTNYVVVNFPELEPPTKIDIPNTGSFLHYSESRALENPNLLFGNNSVSMSTNIGGIYDIVNDEKTELDKDDIVFYDPKYGPVYFTNGCYQIRLIDGSVHLYDLVPYFMITSENEIQAGKQYFPAEFSVNIAWDNNNYANYKFGLAGEYGGGGCGGSRMLNCRNIANNYDWFDEDKLVKVGITMSNDNVYELSDKETNPFYEQVFQHGKDAIAWDLNKDVKDKSEIQEPDDETLREIFFNQLPLFFWKDYMGNWRMYQNSNVRSMAECGKPVIYLYPEETMEINVQVDPEGGFKYTDPVYPTNGWDVISTPDSKITSLADNKIYPYLFWEGYAYDIATPRQGWVLKNDEVGERMNEILKLYGLNEIETKDFLEFWQPKLEVSDYVYVTFVSQVDFDRVAPLEVTPKPDTVIRIFMDYIPLDQEMRVPAPEVKTPARNGFTVVEWGGRIY